MYHHFVGYVCNRMSFEKYSYSLALISAHVLQFRFLVSLINLGSRNLNFSGTLKPEYIFTTLLEFIVYNDAKAKKGSKSGIPQKLWLVTRPGMLS